MIPFTITPSSITVLLRGKNWQLDQSHVNFFHVRQKLLQFNDERDLSHDTIENELEPLINIRAFIAQISTGRVQVNGEAVLFDGKEVRGHIAQRLMQMVRGGRNPRPLMRFLERLDRAPIQDVADQFLRWLEKSNMPLTVDGCFVAYKYVDRNFMDNWTHKIDNSPGALIPRLEVNSINTDRNQTCARSGYHFCSFDYLGGQKPVMLLKIPPEDVCSFPETEEAKGRCLFYEIINRIPDDEIAARKIEGGDLLYTGMFAADPTLYADPHQVVTPAIAAPELPPGTVEEVEQDWDEEEDAGVDPGYAASLLPKRKKPEEKSLTAREKWLARLKGTEFGGKRLTEARVKQLVDKHGYREVGRRTGIPRSTLQDWVDKS